MFDSFVSRKMLSVTSESLLILQHHSRYANMAHQEPCDCLLSDRYGLIPLTSTVTLMRIRKLEEGG